MSAATSEPALPGHPPPPFWQEHVTFDFPDGRRRLLLDDLTASEREWVLGQRRAGRAECSHGILTWRLRHGTGWLDPAFLAAFRAHHPPTATGDRTMLHVQLLGPDVDEPQAEPCAPETNRCPECDHYAADWRVLSVADQMRILRDESQALDRVEYDDEDDKISDALPLEKRIDQCRLWSHNWHWAFPGNCSWQRLSPTKRRVRLLELQQDAEWTASRRTEEDDLAWRLERHWMVEWDDLKPSRNAAAGSPSVDTAAEPRGGRSRPVRAVRPAMLLSASDGGMVILGTELPPRLRPALLALPLFPIITSAELEAVFAALDSPIPNKSELSRTLSQLAAHGLLIEIPITSGGPSVHGTSPGCNATSAPRHSRDSRGRVGIHRLYWSAAAAAAAAAAATHSTELNAHSLRDVLPAGAASDTVLDSSHKSSALPTALRASATLRERLTERGLRTV